MSLSIFVALLSISFSLSLVVMLDDKIEFKFSNVNLPFLMIIFIASIYRLSVGSS